MDFTDKYAYAIHTSKIDKERQKYFMYFSNKELREIYTIFFIERRIGFLGNVSKQRKNPLLTIT